MKNKRNSGQSLVELALFFTLLLLLLGGAVDLGRAFFGFMAIRDAAQEGATFAALFPKLITTTGPGIYTIDAEPYGKFTAGDIDYQLDYRIRTSATMPLNLKDVDDIKITVVNNCPISVKVTVIYHYRALMPFINELFGSQSYYPIQADVTETVLTNTCN